MNILIPMAGRGRRFSEKGYDLPKPLIPVNGMPMIAKVLENIKLDGQYIFITQESQESIVKPVLLSLKSDAIVIPLNAMTEGAACTCLFAKKYINNDDHLLIANCDQLMDWDVEDFKSKLNEDVDGWIFTYLSNSLNNSYIKVNRYGIITKVAEKELISNIATCGVYHWSKGTYMVNSCESMINANIRSKGEFYLCPSYNEMIENGLILKPFPVKAHYPLGTPEELEAYHGNI